jgi:hypothetical protein
MEGNVMMIPGAWEPRGRSGAPGSVVNVVEGVDPLPAASRAGNQTVFPGPDTQRSELPGWLKVSIFAATLLTVMWLAMTVFFVRVT